MWSLGENREGSCSSALSFEEWCRPHEGSSQTQCQTKQRTPSRTGILGFLGRKFLDSFDAEPAISLTCPVRDVDVWPETGNSGNVGHRVRDSFASLGSRDSSRSLHGAMSNCKKNQEDEDWIKVDLIVTDDTVDMGLSFLTGKMKQLYLMERARDEIFLSRYDGPSPNKSKKNIAKTSIKSQNHVPTHHEDLAAADDCRPCPTHRKCHSDAKVSGFVKSLSMTTLAMSGAFEPMDAVKEEADGYNVDGHCLQHIVPKTLSTSSATCGCGRPLESQVHHGWPFASPKMKKGIHQSLKAKWQPVSRAISRCYSWDGCSSESSSRYGISTPCGFIKRFVCCSSNLSSDDDDFLGY